MRDNVPEEGLLHIDAHDPAQQRQSVIHVEFAWRWDHYSVSSRAHALGTSDNVPATVAVRQKGNPLGCLAQTPQGDRPVAGGGEEQLAIRIRPGKLCADECQTSQYVVRMRNGHESRWFGRRIAQIECRDPVLGRDSKPVWDERIPSSL